MRKKYKYIYGPVASWRLGKSLGVDAVSTGTKVCNFDCIYCQIGKTEQFSGERKVFIPTKEIISEIKSLPHGMRIDYITFSGAGEPTLAKNLGQIITKVRKIRKEKIAVFTNSSLIYKKDVQRDLSLADFVSVKLDAHLQGVFARINRPFGRIKFNKIIEGIKNFRRFFKGKLALQIMFVEGNRGYAASLAKIAKEINADEVQINTPLRPCGVKPLPPKELDKIKQYFKSMNYISAYSHAALSRKTKAVKPVDKKAALRRGR